MEPITKAKTIWVTQPTAPFLRDYIQIRQLGRAGQYGVTYQCQRKSDGRMFAVKYLNKTRYYKIHKKDRDRYLKAMRDEVNILQSLKHKNIIKLEDIYEDITTLYIVMEECKGGELFTHIYKRGIYTENDARNVINQLLSALIYLHEKKNVIHCDLKPDNILFADKNNENSLKIIDFGMSKYVKRLQYASAMCGTAYYTAPEVIADRKYNHSSDMWSVGVILFVMIYGYPPFYADPAKYKKQSNLERKEIYRKIVNGFEPKIKSRRKYGFGPWFPDDIKTSKEVRDLIGKLLQKQVRKRYTAKEAMMHPWITNNKQSMDLEKCMFSKIVHFNKENEFKLIITKLFRVQFYKQRLAHFRQLKLLFFKYDIDNDFILSFEEFEKAIHGIHGINNVNRKDLEMIYQRLTLSKADKDGDIEPIGIGFADLVNALVYDYLVSCDERLYDAFKKLDDNNDGKITINELKQKLQRMEPVAEWDKKIALTDEPIYGETDEIDVEGFFMNLHPNYQQTPKWIHNIFVLDNNE